MTTKSNCTCGYNIANYLTKYSLKMANGRHTPKEILLGKKPNLNNLSFLHARYLSMFVVEKKLIEKHVAFLWVTMNNQRDFGATTHQLGK